MKGRRGWRRRLGQLQALKAEGTFNHPDLQGRQRQTGFQRQGVRASARIEQHQRFVFTVHTDGQPGQACAIAVVQDLQLGVTGKTLGVAQVQGQRGPGAFGHQARHAGAWRGRSIGVGISHLAPPAAGQTGFAHQRPHPPMADAGMDKSAGDRCVGRGQLAHHLVAEKSRGHVAVAPHRDAPATRIALQPLAGKIGCGGALGARLLQRLGDLVVVGDFGGFGHRGAGACAGWALAWANQTDRAGP